MASVLYFCYFLGVTLQLAGCAEYCWQAFNASCPSDHIVVMQHAKYGRMGLGRCLTRDYYTGCSADVLEYMDRMCSGRQECEVSIPDTDLHKKQPCPKDLMAYMEADYKCVPVVHPDLPRCQPGTTSSEKNRILTEQSGHISSLVTENSMFGSPSCPWVIQLAEGQKVNITLYDFAAEENRAADASMCTMYASIKERGVPGTQMTICGGDQRIKPIFLSDTNRVEIHLMLRPQGQPSNPYFMLRYQAIGCGPVTTPEGGWTRRVGNRATLACNSTGEVWHVVCDGSRWVGKVGNCSIVPEGQEDERDEEGGAMPYGLILAVIIGVVLGVVIGVCLLSLVVACQRRIRSSKQPSLHPVQPCMNTIDKQHMLRTPEYGYAHVWELQQLQGEDTTVHFAPVKQVETVPFTVAAGQTRLGPDHKYESPQFLRIDNTLGRMPPCQYPEFHQDLDTPVRHSGDCEQHQSSDEQRYTN